MSKKQRQNLETLKTNKLSHSQQKHKQKDFSVKKSPPRNYSVQNAEKDNLITNRK